MPWSVLGRGGVRRIWIDLLSYASSYWEADDDSVVGVGVDVDSGCEGAEDDEAALKAAGAVAIDTEDRPAAARR